MPTNATRLSDRQLKAVKATGKDFVLSDGDGLQLRVRASGSMMWNFNYREPLTRSRINMALGHCQTQPRSTVLTWEKSKGGNAISLFST